jgi:signal transduction histidine kinase
VKDEGMGIKPEDIEKLFAGYQRVNSDHMRYISGFGIELYLSAEITQFHNGGQAKRVWAPLFTSARSWRKKVKLAQ